MSKLLVVIGIAGQQDGSVASLFSQEPGWKARGITRNQSSHSALAWTSKGVEMVQVDLNDPFSLPAAFSENQALGEYCSDIELQQGKNVSDAASQVPPLERIVISSLVDAETLSGGRFMGYLRESHPELTGKPSAVVMWNYMGNWLRDLILEAEEALVGSGTTPLPHIDVERDTGYLVRALLECPPGKTVLGAGDMISWSEMLRVWCECFDQLSIDQFERFVPVPGLGR
ncbi:hypothetical protein BGZ57DRAFT_943930 [Hyaloscypha finlandica]|nr:hypothetical protein BGZ57DRAFT_943930 [Hyaloscypha finlandica]